MLKAVDAPYADGRRGVREKDDVGYVKDLEARLVLGAVDLTVLELLGGNVEVAKRGGLDGARQVEDHNFLAGVREGCVLKPAVKLNGSHLAAEVGGEAALAAVAESVLDPEDVAGMGLALQDIEKRLLPWPQDKFGGFADLGDDKLRELCDAAGVADKLPWELLGDESDAFLGAVVAQDLADGLKVSALAGLGYVGYLPDLPCSGSDQIVGVAVARGLVNARLDDHLAVLQVDRRALKVRDNGICSVGCDPSADTGGCGLVDKLGVSAENKRVFRCLPGLTRGSPHPF